MPKRDPTRGVGWGAGWQPPVGSPATSHTNTPSAQPAVTTPPEQKSGEANTDGDKPVTGWHDPNLTD